jgi:hypothetical protein
MIARFNAASAPLRASVSDGRRLYRRARLVQANYGQCATRCASPGTSATALRNDRVYTDPALVAR